MLYIYIYIYDLIWDSMTNNIMKIAMLIIYVCAVFNV